MNGTTSQIEIVVFLGALGALAVKAVPVSLTYRLEVTVKGRRALPPPGILHPFKSAVAKENPGGRRQDSLGVLGVLAVNAVVGCERLRQLITASTGASGRGAVTHPGERRRR